MPYRGLKLKLASEVDADERTTGLFADIKQVLGVPYVGILFRAYGAYPAFLDLFWQTVRPGLVDARFFALADRLRASAYTRVYSYFPVPDFCARAEQMRLSPGARQELTSTVGLLCYQNALQLVLAAAVLQAFDRPIGRAPESPQPAEHPVFRVRPVLVDEVAATPRVVQIYDEIKRAFGMPVVNTDFRAFARFPDFLEDYWAVLRPTVELPLYAESHFGVQDTALAVAREFPAVVDLRKERLENAGIGDDDLAAVLRATEMLVKLLSAALLNVVFAKIGFDGGTAKQKESKEPAAEPTRAA